LWQWQDENSCWQTYDQSVCKQLERAYTSGGTHVELTVAGRKYRVDVKKMEQINVRTKVARSVQRNCTGNIFSMFYIPTLDNFVAICTVSHKNRALLKLRYLQK